MDHINGENIEAIRYIGYRVVRRSDGVVVPPTNVTNNGEVPTISDGGRRLTLTDVFADIPDVLIKLYCFGITELKDILGLNQMELNQLCGPEHLNLTGVSGLIFKSRVRLTQIKYGGGDWMS